MVTYAGIVQSLDSSSATVEYVNTVYCVYIVIFLCVTLKSLFFHVVSFHAHLASGPGDATGLYNTDCKT